MDIEKSINLALEELESLKLNLESLEKLEILYCDKNSKILLMNVLVSLRQLNGMIEEKLLDQD